MLADSRITSGYEITISPNRNVSVGSIEDGPSLNGKDKILRVLLSPLYLLLISRIFLSPIIAILTSIGPLTSFFCKTAIIVVRTRLRSTLYLLSTKNKICTSFFVNGIVIEFYIQFNFLAL